VGEILSGTRKGEMNEALAERRLEDKEKLFEKSRSFNYTGRMVYSRKKKKAYFQKKNVGELKEPDFAKVKNPQGNPYWKKSHGLRKSTAG